MNEPDKTLIILAGGKSVRFGKIGTLIPKFLIPFNDSNLLQKQIDYAIGAGIKKIIISTLPEFTPLIEEPISVPQIEIFPNSHHRHQSRYAGERFIHRRTLESLRTGEEYCPHTAGGI